MNRDLPEFDVLMALYQHDPEAFEDFRRHMLRKAVDHAPLCHRPTLECLLQRIEQERRNAASPLDAALIATRMMRESAERLLDAWEEAQHTVAGLQAAVLIERVRRQPSA